MDAAAVRGRAAVAAVPLVLVPALGAVQGGFEPDAWVWSGALAAWAAAMGLVLSREAGAVRRAWPWAAAALALLGWTILSATWSVRPAQSVLEARRTVVYAAVILALIVLARRGIERVLVPATTAAVAGLVLYALLRYLLSARNPDPFEALTLNQPLGYANALGILAALGILLALARDRTAPLVPPLALALLSTGSTASWLALGVGLAVAALLERSPLGLVVRAGAVAVPAALLVGLGRLSRFDDTAATTPRIGGAWLLLAALAAALAAAGILRLTQRPADGRGRRLVLAAVLFIALGGAFAIARSGSTEPRASYWHVAWYDEYVHHAALGSGAGTFAYYWVREGKPAEFGGALDAHSLYLETLAELGPVGLVLLAAMLLAPFRGARIRAPYVPAALGAYSAFLVHAALDWDWEMPAVVVAALCCAAAGLAVDSRPLGRAARAALLVGAVVLGAAAVAGARSNTVQEAERAPQSGALSHLHARKAGYLPLPFPLP